MDPAALFTAIKARAEADSSALVGLFGASSPALVTGIFHGAVPEEQPMPYLLWDLESATPDDAFGTAVQDTFGRMHVWVQRDSYAAGTADGAEVTASAIMQRVWGDWHQQASHLPTFGFDRWVPTLGGAWTGGMMIRTAVRAEHETGELHYVMGFRIHQSISAP